MKSTSPAWPVLRVARRVHDFFAELNYAQRRVISRRLSTDVYLKQPNRAPDTYAEFLMRTRAPLMHEPPAAARGARPVR